MERVRHEPRSPAQLATSRALDIDIERTLRGEESPYGDKAAFIPADLVNDANVQRHHARGAGVVIVDADGTERYLPVPESSATAA